MNVEPNSMQCGTPEALRFLASAAKTAEAHWMKAAADEIERLHMAIRRLAEQDATLSVCNGNVTVTLDATLTDAERTCLGYAIRKMDAEYAAGPADVLRCLLQRTDRT